MPTISRYSAARYRQFLQNYRYTWFCDNLEGGGYLDICTDSEVDLKAQLRELALMGVSKTWLNIAEAVGVLAFLKIWQVLDQQARQGAEIGSSVRVTVPQFGRYLRYQRNQVILSMARNNTVDSFRGLTSRGARPVNKGRYLIASLGQP